MKKTIAMLLVIALGLLLAACSVSGYTYPDSRRYTAGGATVTGRVEKLDVSWIAGEVNIGYHKGESVVFSEQSARSLKEEQELRWWLDGDTLCIKYAQSGFRSSANLNKELTVLLPEGMKLSNMDINMVSADLLAENVQTDLLRINTVSGSVNLTAERADRVEVNSVSGDQLLRFERAPQRLDADAVSGDVTLLLPENAGFTAELNTVSGRVSGSMPMQKNGDRYTHGDGASRIHVHTVSGDLQMDAIR